MNKHAIGQQVALLGREVAGEAATYTANCLAWGGLCQGECDRDFRAVGTGLDIEIASQVADSLAHSRDADTGTLIANRGESFFGYARAIILNLQRDGGDFASQADHRRLGVGMAMNIGQTFLDDAKDGHFHIAGQSSKVVGNVQVDFQSAAFRQSGHEPADGFG